MKFFSFWDGPNLSLYEKLCAKSFEHYGHDLRIYTYSPEISDGYSNVFPAEKIVNREIFTKFKKMSSFANHFRYVALQDFERDSIWVDLDVLCTSKYWPQTEFVAGFETRSRINNAVLKIPHDSELLRFLIENSRNDESRVHGETGPFLLTNAMREFGSKYVVSPNHFFYPMGHWQLDLLIDPNNYEIALDKFKDSCGIHLYNELLVRAAIPKNVVPPVGSFLHEQMLMMLPEASGRVVLDSEWLHGWRRNFQERRKLNQLASVLGPLKPLVKSKLKIGL